MKHLEMKQLVSSIKTKKELTNDLTQKLAANLEEDFVFERTYLQNLPDLGKDLRIYGQEEADIGIVLHAIDKCNRDSFR